MFQPISVTQLSEYIQTNPPNGADIEGYIAGIDFSQLRQIREYNPADFIITVETGMTIGELNEHLAPNQQQFPGFYAPDTRIIEILAEDRPSVSTIFAYPRDSMLGLEVINYDGCITKCGGKVVKNVTGYDLTRLYVGSRHQLAVITTASILLKPRPAFRHGLIFSAPKAQTLLNLLDAIEAEGLPCIDAAELLEVSEDQWDLVLSVANDRALVENVVAEIKHVAETTKPADEVLKLSRMLNTTETERLLTMLSKWPNGSAVLELALVPSAVTWFLSEVDRIPGAQYQIRPRAQLVYLQFDAATIQQSSAETAIKGITHIADQLGGSWQWIRSIQEATTIQQNPPLSTHQTAIIQQFQHV